MRKILLILTALMMVLSGVAAVSAYEAHVVNVTAHVENALIVDRDHIDFGTVFPQEWLTDHFNITLSQSAQDEKPEIPREPEAGDLMGVTYALYAEWKITDNASAINPVVVGSDNLSYYAWLGEALYLGIGVSGDNTTGMTLVGPAPVPGPPGAKIVSGFGATLDGIVTNQIVVGIDVPVFEGFYNPLTDPEPKPSGLDDPTWIILTGDYRYFPNGVDLGLDLKIQVTDIERFVPGS